MFIVKFSSFKGVSKSQGVVRKSQGGKSRGGDFFLTGPDCSRAKYMTTRILDIYRLK